MHLLSRTRGATGEFFHMSATTPDYSRDILKRGASTSVIFSIIAKRPRGLRRGKIIVCKFLLIVI